MFCYNLGIEPVAQLPTEGSLLSVGYRADQDPIVDDPLE
jgi:hypothetical protein